jgi:hypothetical protein
MKGNSGLILFSVQISIGIAILFIFVSISLWIANFRNKDQQKVEYLTKVLGSCTLQFLGGGLVLESDTNYQIYYGYDVFPDFSLSIVLYVGCAIIFQIVMIILYRLWKLRHI